MSSPWMKFYPTDWRADPALRMCSLAARGLWMEMLCVMHEAEPYGALRVNGKPISDKQLASLAGAHIDDASALLTELEDAGVFSRDDDGVVVSRRMQRDKAKAESDKANGKRGGNPGLKDGVNPTVKGEDKAQKPEARNQTDNPDATASGAPEDPREILWSHGVEYIKAKTGKTEPAAKSIIGKWVRDAGDDCSLVLSKIRIARDERIGEPIAWITAALKPPDKSTSKPRNAGELARMQLKAMSEKNAAGNETRYIDQSNGNADYPGSGIASRFAISAGG